MESASTVVPSQVPERISAATNPAPVEASDQHGLREWAHQTSAEVTMMPTGDLVLHPEHALVPEMSEDEFKLLLDDVRANGIRDPIAVDVDGKTILDGKHRHQAAAEAGLAVVPVRVAPRGSDDAALYMLRAALTRRHLSDDQRACLVAELAHRNPQRGGDRKSKEARQNQSHPAGVGLKGKAKKHPTLARFATTSNVPVSKAIKASQLLNSDPDLEKQVREGKASLAAARGTARERKARKGPGVPDQKKSVLVAAPPASTAFIAAAADVKAPDVQGLVDELGARLRSHAAEVLRGLLDLAAILEKDDLAVLGDTWSWLGVMPAQLDRVTSLLRGNDSRRKAIMEHAAAVVGNAKGSGSQVPEGAPSSSSDGASRSTVITPAVVAPVQAQPASVLAATDRCSCGSTSFSYLGAGLELCCRCGQRYGKPA